MNEKEVRRYRRILFAILVLSFLLRAFLVFSGGQNFWPDESRYNKSRAAAEALWAGDLPGSLRVFYHADHLLFEVIGLVPATMQIVFAPNPKIPALFFSLFSVASLWLIWGIVRRLGENERVALFAVGLLALCTTFLYYCRHLLPYDTAMALGLLSLFVGLRTPSRAVDSILCGHLFGMCLLDVQRILGTRGLCNADAHPATTSDTCRVRETGLDLRILLRRPPRGPILIKCRSRGRSLAAVPGLFPHDHAGQFLRGVESPLCFPLAFRTFSDSSLGGCSDLWSQGICLREPKGSDDLGLSGIFFIYGTLVVFSVVLEKFVVYGRLVSDSSCHSVASLQRYFWSDYGLPLPKGRPLVVVVLSDSGFSGGREFPNRSPRCSLQEFR